MNTPRTFVIAVDGPAGSGKSSVSKGAARALDFAYLDTGAVYRALTWKLLEDGIDVGDAVAVIRSLPSFSLNIGTDPDRFFVRVGDTDVTRVIREPWVTSEVKLVSRLGEVRAHLTELFRDTIRSTRSAGIVVEGRDITTHVAPDAHVRVLLTASEDVRMARRSAELSGDRAAEAGERLRERDRADSLVTDFLTAADGVTVLDSTDLDFEGTVAALVAIAVAAGAPHPAHAPSATMNPSSTAHPDRAKADTHG